jgi:cob(I)alamin adenosyltransferase
LTIKEQHLNKGLVIIFTGDGKGKTSAAMGIALRASGHKMYVSIVQFVKSDGATGEARAFERFAPELEFVSSGKGFVNCCGDAKPLSEHKKSALEALALARQRMESGSWHILVLDEIITAVTLKLIDSKAVLDLLALKPLKLHIILTGRGATEDLIAAADLVTEMRNIKHPYENGIDAQKGIDY